MLILSKASPIYVNVWCPSISLGALSPEAHETLSIAMNLIKSQIQVKVEDLERFTTS